MKQRDDKIRDQAAGEDYHDDVPDTLRDMAQQAGYGRVDEVDRRKAAEPPEELNTQSAADLKMQLVEAKKELFNLRFQNATNQLDNTSRIKEVRKNIARIQTVINVKSKAEA